MHNPTFKTPSGPRPHRVRSPSPPRAHVEPLSPPRPAPIEPSFNYPAIDRHVDFSSRLGQDVAATPRIDTHATAGHKRRHHRASSTIDTLAEAALAVSPAYTSHCRHSSASARLKTGQNGSYNAYPPSSPAVYSEPPHKRSRSEVLPSPYVGQYASRPATSYVNGAQWSPAVSHTPQTEHAYDRRVEEAALLLNFRTGGWPNAARLPPPPPPAAPRPHANSFPQDLHNRPFPAAQHAQHAQLLPPFYHGHGPPQEQFMPLAPRQRSGTLPASQNWPSIREDIVMEDAQACVKEPPEPNELAGKPGSQALQNQTIGDDSASCAPETDDTPSEATEPAKPKRGWPKGKPRGSSARKSLAEKATAKRTPGRRKATEGAKPGKSKKAYQDTFQELAGEWAAKHKLGLTRRRSFNDANNQEEVEAALNDRSQSVPRQVPMLIRGVSPTKATRRAAKIAPEIICAGCSTSREAAPANSESDEWVSCNGCRNWFHIDCAGFKKAHEVRDVDKYFCAGCEPKHGKTTYVRKSSRAHAAVDYAELQKGVLKTSEESNEHHYIQPIKDGTLFQFDVEDFPRMRPELLTQELLERSDAFTKPICVPAEWNPRPWKTDCSAKEDAPPMDQAEDVLGQIDADPETFEYESVPDHGQDKMDMVMPRDLTVRQVCELVGPDWPLDVIEVKTQNSGQKWTLKRWADYYEQDGDDKPIRNVISLEVSQTKLGRLIRRPKIARDIDLQDDVWPQAEIDKGKWPKVQFYCLMSIADSYTDFHIDFGGSSVYYHILKGSKTFFFIPPKPKHLKAYEEWNESPQQNFTFLPNITKECYRVDLHEGDTMLIPSGWIHAVWTPSTSLVIGGNFLTRMSYHNQFRVVDIEKANETPMKFRYPFFQKIMWYTVLQYLKNDPIPPDVSQLFHDGKQFERQYPVWEDFDGDLANEEDRVGAQNARYYGKAEIEGLAELSNYIFRTVMTVMGRVEGISADKQRRVNASIPKGHGEPLELAKTFALWVAWKRGNEDPPAWAHPDAVLPNSKEEGPPKKLSARALREMERKEAIAAYRVAPDRQSARVVAKTANVNDKVANSFSPPKAMDPSPPPSDPSNGPLHRPQMQTPPAFSQPPTVASPASLMMSNQHGPLLSTPKTSVLGPKRVACDQCRKRRIKCKHKDLVMHINGTGPGHGVNGMEGQSAGNLAPELHDNITVTHKVRPYPDVQSQVNGSQFNEYEQGTPNGDGIMVANGGQGQYFEGPRPGTSAYLNANIPMAMNGVAMFGDMGKRGRTKACVECRKSKRRCIHDDNGNVDPVKAAETPAPRGSASSKKRPSAGGEDDPTQPKRQRSTPAPNGVPAWNPQQHQISQEGQSGVLIPQSMASEFQANMGPKSQRQSKTPDQQYHYEQRGHHEQPNFHQDQKVVPQEQPHPVDPSLYSLYPEPSTNAPSGPYTTAASHPYPSHQQQSQGFQHLQSLEQIANEVLDMNGRHHEDLNDNMFQDPTEQFLHQDALHGLSAFENGALAAATQGMSKPDESVDSAVSMSTNDSQDRNGVQRTDRPSTNGNGVPSPTTMRRPSTHGGVPQVAPPNGLPLYQPPAPLPKSPEAHRRPTPFANGIKSQSPELRQKNRRPSQALVFGDFHADGRADDVVMDGVDDVQSLRLARELQQEGFGLRRRS